jgi:hypothetical protein
VCTGLSGKIKAPAGRNETHRMPIERDNMGTSLLDGRKCKSAADR